MLRAGADAAHAEAGEFGQRQVGDDEHVASTASARARGTGTSEGIAEPVMFALTNTFLTGASLSVDGGEPLV